MPLTTDQSVLTHHWILSNNENKIEIFPKKPGNGGKPAIDHTESNNKKNSIL